MSDCIPIQYAADRASGYVTTNQIVGEINENSLPVDNIRDILVAAGWTQTGTTEASGTLFFLIGLPAAGSHQTQQASIWRGTTYVVYDPADGLPLTGFPVAEGGTSDDTLRNLCGAMSDSDFTWSFVDSHTIRVDANPGSTAGTAGNGLSFTGQFGASGSTRGGGWELTSAAANGVTSIVASVSGGGGSSGVSLIFTLNGHSRGFDLAALFGPASYRLLASSHQVIGFRVGDTSRGPEFIACAPYVPTDWISTLGYTAFVGQGNATVISDPDAYAAPLEQSTSIYTQGTWIPGGSFSILLRRMPYANALTVSSGKTLATGADLMLTMPDASLKVVGAMWDAMIESTERNPEIDEVQYDGHDWRVMLTQGGGGGGFNFRSTGTAWIAIG